jgi:hypothetical protein
LDQEDNRFLDESLDLFIHGLPPQTFFRDIVYADDRWEKSRRSF